VPGTMLTMEHWEIIPAGYRGIVFIRVIWILLNWY